LTAVGALLALIRGTSAANGTPPSAPEAAPAAFDPAPWLHDLEEARTAFSTKYAGLEWEVFGRDHDISSTFATARERITHARSQWDAAGAFGRLVNSFGDKHVTIRWPSLAPRGGQQIPTGTRCDTLGYATEMQAKPLAALLPGYMPLGLPADNVFPTGVLVREGQTIGIIKIPSFSARAFPPLCEMTIDELRLDRTKSCDTTARRR